MNGRLFEDITEFHKKFGLEPPSPETHVLPSDLLAFRVKFIIEELKEYCSAMGVDWWATSTEDAHGVSVNSRYFPDMENVLDALVDLTYVVLGLAYVHGFKFNEAWDRVHAANMTKVRAQRTEDSARGGTWDVVKPPDFKRPDLGDLL